MLSFLEYKEYYEKNGTFIDSIYRIINKKNDKQIHTAYLKYVKKEKRKQEKFKKRIQKSIEKEKERYEEKLEKKIIKDQERGFPIDEKWEEVRKQVKIRDNFKCRFLSTFPKDLQKQYRKDVLKGHLATLDCAHIFSRANYPKLKYDIDNIVLLSRYFHYLIDNNFSPVTGKRIKEEEKKQFWLDIIGKKLYNELEKKAIIDKRED